MIRAFPGWDCGDWSRTAAGLVTATRYWACYWLAVVTVHPSLVPKRGRSYCREEAGRVAPSMATQAWIGNMPGSLGVALQLFHRRLH